MIKGDKLTERGPARDLRKAINRLQDQVNSLRIAQGVGYMVKHTALGQILHISSKIEEGAAPPSINIRRFQVVSVKPKYLSCRQINSAGTAFDNTTVYKVMRPYSTWLNDDSVAFTGWSVSTTDTTKNVSRSLSKLEDNLTYTISQRVYPTWVESPDPGSGDYIIAAKDIEGWSFYDETVTPREKLEWCDLNVDARHWAFDSMKKVAVCLNNQTKFMWLFGSEIGV